jgi:uncharacterized phage protein gp47/JayE
LRDLAQARGDIPPATEEGEFFYDLLYPIAEEISEQQQLLEYAFLQAFLPWADGPFLDAHGYLVGLDRNTDESDDSYRQRLVLRARMEEGNGRRIDYETWAMEIPGVGGAVAIEHERSDVSIDLYLTDPYGQPVTQEFADSVTAALWDTKRIGGHDLKSHPAPLFHVDVAVKITLSDESKRAAAIELIAKRLQEYLQGRTEIVYQQMGSLFFVDGVSDYSGFTLNGGTANLTKPMKAVARLSLEVT